MYCKGYLVLITRSAFESVFIVNINVIGSESNKLFFTSRRLFYSAVIGIEGIVHV